MVTTNANPRKVVTGKVRLSYVHLDTPQVFEDGSTKFTVKVLVPKTDKVTIKKIRSAQKAAIELGESAGKFKGKKVKRNSKTGEPDWGGAWDTVHDGDDTDKDEDAGNIVFTVTNRNRPGIVDRQLNNLEPGEVYSGCYARVSLTAGPYNYQGKIGVTFYLDNVQFLSDGPPLDGRSVATDDFSDEYEDEDDYDEDSPEDDDSDLI